jgi:hypothetical protein
MRLWSALRVAEFVSGRAREVRFAQDSPLEGAGFEPSVPLVRPVLELARKRRQSFVRNVSRDACAPVKCSGGAAILTIEWLDGDQRHARTLYRNPTRCEARLAGRTLCSIAL